MLRKPRAVRAALAIAAAAASLAACVPPTTPPHSSGHHQFFLTLDLTDPAAGDSTPPTTTSAPCETFRDGSCKPRLNEPFEVSSELLTADERAQLGIGPDEKLTACIIRRAGGVLEHCGHTHVLSSDLTAEERDLLGIDDEDYVKAVCVLWRWSPRRFCES